MLELSSLKKNRISLSDYNSEQDIANRILMASFSIQDLEVLEEILFSPLKISIKKLMKDTGCSESTLHKLAPSRLFIMQGDYLIVDKDLRKYFEFEITRFDPDFKPDMEFLTGLLRKIPIHQLPLWYSISRTSNHIFTSVIEKYLLTPHTFQRYLATLSFEKSYMHQILSDLFSAPGYQLDARDVMAKYQLSPRDFEEMTLLLEFHLIGCISYKKENDHWIEVITPFYEWRQYLCFLRDTEPAQHPSNTVQPLKQGDFAFIEEMTRTLDAPGNVDCTDPAVQKLVLVELASLHKNQLIPSPEALTWKAMSLEDRARYLYRHPKNRIPSNFVAEKAIKRVLHGNWVDYNDFLRGVLVPFSEDSVVQLKQTGKHWKYSLPTYSEEEKKQLKRTIFEWLFEMGMVRIGKRSGEDCFAVTPFGRFFFED